MNINSDNFHHRNHWHGKLPQKFGRWWSCGSTGMCILPRQNASDIFAAAKMLILPYECLNTNFTTLLALAERLKYMVCYTIYAWLKQAELVPRR